mmetsp:Transcript_29292/g.85444  ORF Transcript_29292/g.85444 Transcript_29292/m.85444 type:complete len:312 (+) Transcript_29292:956-1891(+)
MCGAKLVFPGPRLDGHSIYEMLRAEQVTVSAGVPTVWLMLLDHMEHTEGASLPDLQRLVIGGSATPPSLVEAFEDKYNVNIQLSWGMTELSPCGVVGSRKRSMVGWDQSQYQPYQLKPGRAMYGVDMRIVDEEDQELPRDGTSLGRLQVRGPWTIERYWNFSEASTDAEDWFDTGDVATLDEEGYLTIRDRAKDIIKSGGEWISSIEIENVALSHPLVDSSEGPGAAVIAIPDRKYDERPLLVFRRKPGAMLSEEDVREFLAPHFAKWWLPDRVVFVEEPLPLQGTGKVWKLKLRESLAQGGLHGVGVETR